MRLTPKQFYRLTPRQFSLLVKAHRKQLAHREMLHAYTTTAVINYSMGAPDTSATPELFMPNYTRPDVAQDKPGKPIDDDSLTDWQTRIANLALEMRNGGGPLLDQIKAQSNAE